MVLLGLAAASFAEEDVAPPQVSIVISVADQKMALLHDGGIVKKYPVSTSKFGIGDRLGSYMTPVGRLRVCDKIGDGLAQGAVIKHRSATGEILPVNAAGRDPIVTRILWLEGLEPTNDNARGRGIYIHGTVEESKVGSPVSYGCIRMKSRDVAEVFAATPVGTPVEIVPGKLPRLGRPAAAKPETIIVQKAPESRALTLAAAPRPVEKSEARSGAALFGEKAPASKTATTASRQNAETPRPGKVPARAVLLAEGREVPASTADSSQRRIEVSMKSSILYAGLPEIAAAQPESKPAHGEKTSRAH
jgi:hypothetical protein